MQALTAAVVLLGIICAMNLLLVVALARRVRESSGGAGPGIRPGFSPAAYRMPPGTRPGPFHAYTAGGAEVSLHSLRGSRALVGFFAAGCEPCHEQLPAFAELAETIPGGLSQVLAVVSGRQDKVPELTAMLDGVASVVIEEAKPGTLGPVAHAFQAYGRPSYYLLDSSGTVTASAPTVAQLTAYLATAT